MTPAMLAAAASSALIAFTPVVIHDSAERYPLSSAAAHAPIARTDDARPAAYGREVRAREGGSYHVRVSLCRSGMYIYKQGKVEYADPDLGLSDSELAAIMIESNGGHGQLRHLGPVLRMSETKPARRSPARCAGSRR